MGKRGRRDGVARRLTAPSAGMLYSARRIVRRHDILTLTPAGRPRTAFTLFRPLSPIRCNRNKPSKFVGLWVFFRQLGLP